MRIRPAPFAVRVSVIDGPAVAGRKDQGQGGTFLPGGGHTWCEPGMQGRCVLPLLGRSVSRYEK
jgi:hypothetical protein